MLINKRRLLDLVKTPGELTQEEKKQIKQIVEELIDIKITKK